MGVDRQDKKKPEVECDLLRPENTQLDEEKNRSGTILSAKGDYIITGDH